MISDLASNGKELSSDKLMVALRKASMEGALLPLQLITKVVVHTSDVM